MATTRAASLAILLCCCFQAQGLRVAKLGMECFSSGNHWEKKVSMQHQAHRIDSPACSGWQEKAARLVETKRLPFDKRVWTEDLIKKYPLTAESLRNASVPAGYVGARSRWVNRTLRMLLGESVEIAVLGGSMPDGSGVEEGQRYSDQLEKHFGQAGFPNVRVKNLAHAATSSENVAKDPKKLRELESADIVIVDYAINDFLYSHRELGVGPHASAESYDELLQQLIELPQQPEVIEFGSTNYHLNHFHTTMSCTEDVSQFVHRRAEHFQVPIVSFGDSFCHTSQPWWFGVQHPNATTHDLIARMFLGVFGVEVERACSKAPVAEYPKLPPLQERPYSECFRTHPLRFQDYRSGFDGKAYRQADVMEAGLLDGRPSGGWHFGRDLPTKPSGWLVGDNASEAVDASNLIGFQAQTSDGGWIRIDYLLTYGNMGKIACWVEGMVPEEGCVIDGLARVHFSEDTSFFMKVVGGSAEKLRCRASGGKFKILDFSSC